MQVGHHAQAQQKVKRFGTKFGRLKKIGNWVSEKPWLRG